MKKKSMDLNGCPPTYKHHFFLATFQRFSWFFFIYLLGCTEPLLRHWALPCGVRGLSLVVTHWLSACYTLCPTVPRLFLKFNFNLLVFPLFCSTISQYILPSVETEKCLHFRLRWLIFMRNESKFKLNAHFCIWPNVAMNYLRLSIEEEESYYL